MNGGMLMTEFCDFCQGCARLPKDCICYSYNEEKEEEGGEE